MTPKRPDHHTVYVKKKDTSVTPSCSSAMALHGSRFSYRKPNWSLRSRSAICAASWGRAVTSEELTLSFLAAGGAGGALVLVLS